MNPRHRLAVLLAALLVLGSLSVGAVLHAHQRAVRKSQAQVGGPNVVSGNVTLDTPGQTLFRNTAWGPHRGEITSAPTGDPSGSRTATGLQCMRFYAAHGTGICLQGDHGTVSEKYRAVVLDTHLHEVRHFAVAGIPTRARVSPSGRLAAWTVFTGGDSYAGGAFSTRTSIVDTRTWDYDSNLETYRFYKDGHRKKAADINIWGVTFADDTHFYATVATGGQTYLVRGDRTAKTLTALHTNVECPSLSPDGTRIAFKKRVEGADSDAPWRLYVMDLRTMRETATAELENVDDQAVWSGNHALVYAQPGDYGDDLWTVPADGSGHPRRLMVSAVSPAYSV
ncbi:TolB-like translocation protein [Streptomyces sp. BPTC-684]|uniref:TolB family protein n=1 Tax=Streptomyces sp. BPTC-684 TaxID=3043734 RepID=UPI0024B04280|nr:TolB-like translocation protein [Streptomyces sp. BPTC-684]WHM40542.1 TolB-like translocation protein [Streptomyces sp. BPTC-684]